VDQRKVSLDPKDLKRLAALLKEEEARVDALADEELEADEVALEGRIRDFAHGHGVADAAKDSISTNWDEIRLRMESTPSSVKEEQLGRVVPFQAKKKSMPWLPIGGLAAAALALFVLYPNLSNKDSAVPNDYGQQVKGTGVGTGSAASSFCDIDVTGRTPDSVEEAGNGQGYIVTPEENFQISTKCDDPGFIQVWSKGSEATEFRNLAVERNVRMPVSQDGKQVEFTIKGQLPVEYAIVLTDKPIGNEIDLLDNTETLETKSFGSAKILWSDLIHVKGK